MYPSNSCNFWYQFEIHLFVSFDAPITLCWFDFHFSLFLMLPLTYDMIYIHENTWTNLSLTLIPHLDDTPCPGTLTLSMMYWVEKLSLMETGQNLISPISVNSLWLFLNSNLTVVPYSCNTLQWRCRISWKHRMIMLLLRIKTLSVVTPKSMILLSNHGFISNNKLNDFTWKLWTSLLQSFLYCWWWKINKNYNSLHGIIKHNVMVLHNHFLMDPRVVDSFVHGHYDVSSFLFDTICIWNHQWDVAKR